MTTLPEGHVHVWLPDYRWEPVSRAAGTERRCRYGASPHHRACGRVSVARLLRPYGSPEGRWWHYCERHLYGRRLSDDGTQVLARVVVPEEEAR